MPVNLEMLLSPNPQHCPFAKRKYFSSQCSVPEEYSNSYEISLKKPNFLSNGNYSDISAYKNNDLFSISSCGFASRLKHNEHIKSKFSNSVSIREKKRVSFADDKGLSLVEVRAIPQFPSSPKGWASTLFSSAASDIQSDEVRQTKWSFTQPDSSTTEKYFEENNVVLESLSVEEGPEDTASGIVKVKNIAFEKEVFVRVTYDRWITYEDIPATYLPPDFNITSDTCIHDKFHFFCNIKPPALKYEVVEFCICYKSSGVEYWDNNGGINYRISVSSKVFKPVTNNQETSKYITAPRCINIDSKIDVWNSFLNGSYYWSTNNNWSEKQNLLQRHL